MHICTKNYINTISNVKYARSCYHCEDHARVNVLIYNYSLPHNGRRAIFLSDCLNLHTIQKTLSLVLTFFLSISIYRDSVLLL